MTLSFGISTLMSNRLRLRWLEEADFAAGQEQVQLILVIDHKKMRVIDLANWFVATVKRAGPGDVKPFHIFRHPRGSAA